MACFQDGAWVAPIVLVHYMSRQGHFYLTSQDESNEVPHKHVIEPESPGPGRNALPNKP